MAAPNVIPMADIMLVLLIIMMVITPMLQNRQLVDMARAKNWENMPAAERDDAVVVAVTRDGNYYLGNNEIALNQITSTVED
ncbi:MAG: biopolymer transporter ExbD, partial [Candidatus Acidiferrales bacterium]